MKRISIALMTLAATLAAVSCQKVFAPKEQPSGQMTITAVSEQITTPGTKAEMAYKYDVLWQEKDSICVKDASTTAIFKLVKGAGTTKGTFKGGTVTGDVKAYYPVSIVDGDKLVWPAVQQNNQVAPMFCKKNITTDTEEFNFKSLGAVMQIVLTTPLKGITLKSISIEDGEKTMSGEFTVENDSLAVISATDKAGITLDLGDGEAIGETAKYFNIAVPAGEYNDLTLTFTATDGSKCVMKSTTLPEIKRNVVGKLTLCAPQFKGGLPAGALKGEFTVSAEGKKVYFSHGNLVATIDASGVPTAWKFAAHQYDCLGKDGANQTIGVAAGDVDLFGWSTSNNGGTSTTDNYGIKTSTTTSDYSGDFYDWGKAVGDGSTWRTLSKEEWTYLLNNHSKKWVTVNDVNGYVIAPDGFEGTLSDSYADDAALAANNLVFLPAAGWREGSYVNDVGDCGNCWSSSAYDEDSAYPVFFYSVTVDPCKDDFRCNGYSVRLVTDASVTPAPTPTTTGTAKATIGGSQVDVNWVQLWENGPKFAEYNVGASSATDEGSKMTFTDATKAGAEYVWGANWCTPSKDQMDELLKAASSDGSTKVECNYTQENGVYGFKFTGKETDYTGNSVFFPAQNGTSASGLAKYWSSTTSSGDFARYMSPCYDSGEWYSNWAQAKQSSSYLVRPVLKN